MRYARDMHAQALLTTLGLLLFLQCPAVSQAQTNANLAANEERQEEARALFRAAQVAYDARVHRTR